MPIVKIYCFAVHRCFLWNFPIEVQRRRCGALQRPLSTVSMKRLQQSTFALPPSETCVTCRQCPVLMAVVSLTPGGAAASSGGAAGVTAVRQPADETITLPPGLSISDFNVALLQVPFHLVEQACKKGGALPEVKVAPTHENASWLLVGAQRDGDYDGGEAGQFVWCP